MFRVLEGRALSRPLLVAKASSWQGGNYSQQKARSSRGEASESGSVNKVRNHVMTGQQVGGRVVETNLVVEGVVKPFGLLIAAPQLKPPIGLTLHGQPVKLRACHE